MISIKLEAIPYRAEPKIRRATRLTPTGWQCGHWIEQWGRRVWVTWPHLQFRTRAEADAQRLRWEIEALEFERQLEEARRHPMHGFAVALANVRLVSTRERLCPDWIKEEPGSSKVGIPQQYWDI